MGHWNCFRLLALIPLVLSPVAFALTLILVLSGHRPHLYEEYDIIRFNTTLIGLDMIHVSPSETSTSTNQSSLESRKLFESPSKRDNQPESTNLPRDTQQMDSSDSESVPGVKVPLVMTIGHEQVEGDIDLDFIYNGDFANSSNREASRMVSKLMRTAGVQDIYSLHLRDFCSSSRNTSEHGAQVHNVTDALEADSSHGGLNSTVLISMGTGLGSSNETNEASHDGAHHHGASERFEPSRCLSYRAATHPTDVFVKHNISEKLVVTIPLLSHLVNGSTPISAFLATFSTTMFVLLVLSLVASITSSISSLWLLLRRSRKLTNLNLLFTCIGLSCHLQAAIATTVLAGIIMCLVDSFGGDVGITAKRGTRFLLCMWISFTCNLVTHLYWLVVYFVEAREIAYRARRRTPNEIGNWKEFHKEVKSDAKAPLQRGKDQ